MMCLARTTEPDIPLRVAVSISIFSNPSGLKVGSIAMLPRFQIGAGALAIKPNGKPTINTSLGGGRVQHSIAFEFVSVIDLESVSRFGHIKGSDIDFSS
jgi:hypothetical protein